MIVIKFGGHAMKDQDGSFASAIAAAIDAGEKIAVVHGGGPQIDAGLKAAGVESTFRGGFRVTTPEAFTVVEKVLTEEVGPAVVRSLSLAGVNAIAISGRTVLRAKKQQKLVDGTDADLGLVGEVVGSDPSGLIDLLDKGITPVIAPLAHHESDPSVGLNVNGDIAAAAIAGALGASSLIIMTDVPGIYRNWPDASSLISTISASELSSIKEIFAEGMAPKVQATLDAIAAGAHAVRVIDGTNPAALSDALLSCGGTLVTA